VDTKAGQVASMGLTRSVNKFVIGNKMNETHFLSHPRVDEKIILQQIFKNSRGEVEGI